MLGSKNEPNLRAQKIEIKIIRVKIIKTTALQNISVLILLTQIIWQNN